MLTKQFRGIVIDKKDLRPGIQPFPGRADDERRISAFRDSNDDVTGLDASFPQLVASEVGKILIPFDRFDQREIPPGHHTKDPVFHVGKISCDLRMCLFDLAPKTPPRRFQ